MRLWSLHPKYLDPQGLVALWRESLLAQKVLSGATRGYKNHPQLNRFRETSDPLASLGYYLSAVAEEATRRGYKFDATKILKKSSRVAKIPVTRGQLQFEGQHLFKKLKARNPQRLKALLKIKRIQPHPSFRPTPGKIHDWERSIAP
ncbi:MAG: pyrimidine dimer DNA glycosylase/endonuclease V [Pseudomonadota bacterium]|nr:pyrimidine dimer DNA glycosylase/endonuclease V [Pseudomonadota bacterium]